MSNLPVNQTTADLVLNPASMQSMVAFADFMCNQQLLCQNTYRAILGIVWQ